MNFLETLIRRHARSAEVILPDDASARLRKLPGIRAVVFDVYGTLFSSSAGDISLVSRDNHEEIMLSVLQNNGIGLGSGKPGQGYYGCFLDTIRQHQDRRRKDGIQYPEVDIRLVWKDFLSKLESEEYILPQPSPFIDGIAVEFEARVNPVQVMPGMCECLASIRKSGRAMSIISNAQFYTPLLFTSLAGKSLKDFGFSGTASVWSYKLLEGKPSRRLYERAATKLGELVALRPDQVLYVGNDIRNDIWPARETGFRTALFAGDSLSLRRRTDDPQCGHVVPDIELTRLSQIYECIG